MIKVSWPEGYLYFFSEEKFHKIEENKSSIEARTERNTSIACEVNPNKINQADIVYEEQTQNKKMAHFCDEFLANSISNFA